MKITEGRKQIHTLLIDGEKLNVCFYPVFNIVNGRCSQTTLRILEDGRVGLNDEYYRVGDLSDLIEDGRILTKLEESSEYYIHIPQLVSFCVTDPINCVDEGELVKEVVDIIAELNSESTSSSRCRSIFEEFRVSPTEENRLRLKHAYELIPEQLLCWLFGFPEKDAPVRRAIYGDQANSRDK